MHFKKLFAVCLALSVLLSACGEDQDQDIHITVPEDITMNIKADAVEGACFIAPDPSNELLAEVYNSYDCVQGYLYFEAGADGMKNGKPKLLLDKKFKDVWVQGLYQDNEYVWAFTEDNELLKVNKSSADYETLYTAQYGDIGKFVVSDLVREKKVLYFIDGANDAVIYDTDSDTYDILHNDNGITDLYWAGYQEECSKNGKDTYICEECNAEGNYVIWGDNDGNYFWYHPHSGENEPLKIEEDAADKYFIKAEQ